MRRIGTGIPIAQSKTQPIAPRAFLEEPRRQDEDEKNDFMGVLLIEGLSNVLP